MRQDVAIAALEKKHALQGLRQHEPDNTASLVQPHPEAMNSNK